MPTLPTEAPAPESTINFSGRGNDGLNEDLEVVGGKWEDEEERRFFEDIQDLRDFVPKSVLGLEGNEGENPDEKDQQGGAENDKKAREEMEEREVLELESELKRLEVNGGPEEPSRMNNKDTVSGVSDSDDE